MDTFLIAHASLLRLAAFVGVLGLMMCWELLSPRRALGSARLKRWSTNLGLSLLNTVAARLLIPLAVTGAALWAQDKGYGLFNNVPLSQFISYPLSLLVLDLLVYGQHVAFHRIAILWRVHRMHHADTDLDATSGIRFHPIEILLSTLIKMAAVVALGAPVGAVILFEILLNATAMFNHSNVRIGSRTDALLRQFVVTPDMHRVHHSVLPAEHHRNFGFNLSLWDRLLGTYRAQPRDGHEGMTIGLKAFPAPAPSSLLWNLAVPFLTVPSQPERI